ncbi:MAG: DUF7455 domain-containing protein [Mycobacteriales bacterium]
MTATTAPPAPTTPLTLLDRCDSCGAQAFYRAVFLSGDLTFCGHHGRALLAPLQRAALLVEDGTELINSRPSPSANSD